MSCRLCSAHTTLAEFEASRELLIGGCPLAKFGRPGPERIKVGTMLEVPALVWQLDQLLPQIDFLSVGTNDLMQFFFAADRGNPMTGTRYDMLSVAPLRMLDHVRDMCERHDVPVSLCGEMGGKPLQAMALLGLGFVGFQYLRRLLGRSSVCCVLPIPNALRRLCAKHWIDRQLTCVPNWKTSPIDRVSSCDMLLPMLD